MRRRTVGQQMAMDRRNYGARIVSCIALVVERSIELDLAIETMKIAISPIFPAYPDSAIVTVHLTPIPPPGSIILGGGVTFDVDLFKQEIVRVVRHQ